MAAICEQIHMWRVDAEVVGIQTQSAATHQRTARKAMP